MKIHRVTLNKVLDPPGHGIVSSYRNERVKQKEEYYLKREDAVKRQTELHEGAYKLLGFIPNFEAIIDEIEVKE